MRFAIATLGLIIGGATAAAYAATPAPDSNSAGFAVGILVGLVLILVAMPKWVRILALILGAAVVAYAAYLSI
jgi:hypothetical protein